MDKSLQHRQRAWEIDAVRGLMILLMLIGHLQDMVQMFCIDGIYKIDPVWWVNTTDPLQCWFRIRADGTITKFLFAENTFHWIWARELHISFFLISGICCTFSENHLKGGVKLLFCGFFLTGYTYLLYRLTGIPGLYMRFGVIMCMAVCHLIYEFVFKNAKSRILLITALPILISGYYLIFHPITSNSALLHVFGIRQQGDVGEYFPIVPYFGWLLVGVAIGRRCYPERTSLFPVAKLDRLTKPVQWLGRYSGEVYVAHVVLYRTVFPLIGKMLGIM